MTGQPYSLEVLAEERAQLTIPNFDYAFAWQLGSLIRQKAVENDLSVAIEVRHGADVVFATLAGKATIDNFDWTRRKCAAVHRFHRSSLQLRLDAEKGGYDFNQRFRLPPADYVASGGAVPLILTGGTLIGTVAVSGLPDVEDHALVASALRDLIS
ncbi:heme-degrading domain-containing protein [Agrobacterium larrymoorei]|uniref:Heme-binding protein n=1 Tax=Agrobacterium larrymoorei TaxID=160699 RepID=A0A4D7DVM5_9HYPH|nr:heme-binding protein [Agrobacterium larrymoorei]QCJ01132.1 hypothetical protein CFBP5473_24655 [Agrobacterium larrymoorei]QYA10145.1 heme-binding protein [Agrobacterium larrymoorei]